MMNSKYKKILAKALKKIRLKILSYEARLNKTLKKEVKKPIISRPYPRERAGWHDFDPKLLRFFSEQGNFIVTKRQICDRFPDISDSVVHVSIDRLIEKGHIKRIERGKYHRILSEKKA